MTDDKLKDAIAYAFQCCNQTYISGYNASHTEVGKAMLAHLKELLAEQLLRAKQEVSPEEYNSEVDRLRQVCRDTYEVWAGSEGIPNPLSPAEAYLLALVEQMRDEVKKGL
jgi:hypothetical protein